MERFEDRSPDAAPPPLGVDGDPGELNRGARGALRDVCEEVAVGLVAARVRVPDPAPEADELGGGEGSPRGEPVPQQERRLVAEGEAPFDRVGPDLPGEGLGVERPGGGAGRVVEPRPVEARDRPGASRCRHAGSMTRRTPAILRVVVESSDPLTDRVFDRPMRFRFAEFSLDPEHRALRRAGTPVAVENKVFDLLAYLAQINGRLATQDELLAAVWPGVATTPSSLSRAVSLAREALGDRGRREDALIQTVRGRGYRLSAPVRVEDPDAGAADFVGRIAELEQLHRALDLASARRAAAAFVAGRAGIGKTSLIQHFAVQARARGARVALAGCFEEEESPGFWPWTQLLGEVVREVGESRLEEWLGSDRSQLRAFVPELAGASAGATHAGRAGQFAAVARLLERLAEDRTLVIVLDDAHGADDDSLQLLRFVVTGARRMRLVVLGAYRPAERGEGWTKTMDTCRRMLGHTAILELGGLSREDIALLAQDGSGDRPIDVEQLWQRSEGHPFFVRQLLRHARTASESPVPSTVRDAVSVQLADAAPDLVEVLGIAAAAGREIPAEMLARASGRSESEVLGLLAPVVRRGIVEVSGRRPTLRFEHALVWETIYSLRSDDERALAHQRLARAIEAGPGRDDAGRIDALAHHYDAAGLVDEAIRYAEQAVELAIAQLAFDRAIHLYERLLRLLGSRAGGDPRRRCEIRVALADAQFRAGRLEDSATTSWRAIAEARELGALDLFARVAERLAFRRQGNYRAVPSERIRAFEEALVHAPPGDDLLRARLTVGLSVDLYWSDLERSEHLSREALALARRSGDAETLLTVLDQRYQHAQTSGHDDERRALNEEMLALSLRERDLEFEFYTRKHRFHEFVRRTDADGADAELGAMAALAGRLRQPVFDQEVRIARAARALWRGEPNAESLLGSPEAAEGGSPDVAFFAYTTQLFSLRRAQDRLAELEPLVREGLEGFPLLPAFRGGLPFILCEVGRVDEARDAFERHVFREDALLPPTKDYPLNLAIVAEVCARVGNASLAEGLYGRLASHAGQHLVIDSIASFGSADRILGLLAATLGRVDDAIAHLERAIQVERGFGAAPFEAWARRDLAEVRGTGIPRGGEGGSPAT